MTHQEALLDEFEGVVDAHLRPMGATVEVTFEGTSVTLTVTKGEFVLKETVNFGGMPVDIQLEYAHCCGHNLAAMLIQHLYPT